MDYYPEEVSRHLAWSHRPMQALLEDSAREHPDAPATSFFGGVLSFRELDQEANRFAHGLRGLGVRPGDRVAIHLPNSPQLLICLYGTLKAGAVATMANPMYESRELAYQLNDSGASVMVTLSQNEMLKKAITAQQQADIHHLIVTNIKDYFPPALRIAFTTFKEKKEGHRAHLDSSRAQLWLKDIMKKQPSNAPATTTDPTSTAVLQYTGGTTGLPKAAELTHDNLVANTAQVKAWIYKIKDAREKMLMVLPLFHVYALTCCNLCIDIAGQVILLPRFDLSEVLSTISKQRPTIFPGIPAMYAAINHSLLRGREEKKADLSSIWLCVSGSDRLPTDVQEEFERLSGGLLIEGYGLTEASPVTHANLISGIRKKGSIGLPLPDTEVRIIDLDDGKDVQPGEEGEMLVRGPQIMKGYWNESEETEHAIDKDGWLKTGDVARIDEDGFYYIVDRRKDVIITGGINVYPREIEEVLSQFHKIAEVAVKGLPHKLRGEIVKAYVVLKDNEQATAGEIRQFAKEKLADYKVPQKIEFMSELPKNTLRKVLKRKLDDKE
ncbi:MAG: long-chain fatty acid--CoA ligase [Thermoleophilia bacterium]|jgi:long-chain acyl-CoA synthetase